MFNDIKQPSDWEEEDWIGEPFNEEEDANREDVEWENYIGGKTHE